MLLVAVLVTLLLVLKLHHHQSTATAPAPISPIAAPHNYCDFFRGKWIVDSSYPLYDSLACPFVEKEFDCIRNGRPDKLYLKYRWQPNGCDLAKFNGLAFLRKYKGKSIMFVGDSLSRDQYMSLACMIYNSVPNTNYTMIRQAMISTLTFWEYGMKLMLDRNAFLVDVATEKSGKVLKLDTISSTSKLWTQNDLLVFNTCHWWGYKGPQQPWRYIEFGKRLYRDMNRTFAFEIGLRTWARWIDDVIDPAKTMVFFQGVSPSHYIGQEWHERGENCAGQEQPLKELSYPAGLPNALDIQKNAISKMKTGVKFLDITALSQLRIDGHPSFYGVGGRAGSDCTHWCLAGVPDTWNTILYNFIFYK